MLAKACIKSCTASRFLHSSACRRAVTKFQMPAMSPTMTEGNIAQWKKSEGETFSAGDVLLEIETDKATIDVEAQDDGVMGKIIAADGAKGIQVGKTIALIAEEGDDISNLEAPQEEEPSPAPTQPSKSERTEAPQQPPEKKSDPSQKSSSSSSHAPHSSNSPIFPSVIRLLTESNVSDISNIKGSGIRGMVTKGDILAHLGKASSPTGTYKENTLTPSKYKAQAVVDSGKPAPPKPLDAAGVRNAILTAFIQRSAADKTVVPAPATPSFESLIADYLPPSIRPAPAATATSRVSPITSDVIISPTAPSPISNYLDGLH